MLELLQRCPDFRPSKPVKGAHLSTPITGLPGAQGLPEAPQVPMKQTPAKKKPQIDFRIYERQAQICKAFANPVRLIILDLVSKGEVKSADLQETLGITKANLSQHLTVLRTAGIIIMRREGKQVFCSLAMPEVKQACETVQKVLQSQWEGARSMLKR